MSTPFPIPLTADLMATAIVAAARVFGDDPVRTLAGRSSQRRALAPALCAVANQTGQTLKRVCDITGLHAANVSTLRRNPTKRFSDAVAAANKALLWDALERSAAVTRREEPLSPVAAIIARCSRDGRTSWAQVAKQLGTSIDRARSQHDPSYRRQFAGEAA